MGKPNLEFTELCQYIKSKIGYAGKRRVSTYLLGVKALAVDGIVKPSGVGDRCWVQKHVPHIKNSIKKPDQISTFKHFTDNSFLETYEWRKLRMEALKKYGAKCQCCGATPAHGAVMHVDHIKPRKFFPELSLEISNLQVLCHECNHGKGNWDTTDWRGTTPN